MGVALVVVAVLGILFLLVSPRRSGSSASTSAGSSSGSAG